MVIRNRGDRQGAFEVHVHGLPMIEASYSERPLAPGIPRVRGARDCSNTNAYSLAVEVARTVELSMRALQFESCLHDPKCCRLTGRLVKDLGYELMSMFVCSLRFCNNNHNRIGMKIRFQFPRLNVIIVFFYR